MVADACASKAVANTNRLVNVGLLWVVAGFCPVFRPVSNLSKMINAPIPVLIVDDDPAVGAWLNLLVRRMGESLPCSPLWVTKGSEALAALKERDFELALLDYNLPDTDGLTLLAHIQQMPLARQPAAIILTGAGSEEIAVEAMKRGARDYLVKGMLDQATMRRAMAGALDRRRLELQLEKSSRELREKNAQMEAELEMAREVQQALLPQQYPRFPAGVPEADSSLRFAHRWIPSSGMAGDFFEVFALGDDRAGVFVCDVMGHGVRAALITALMRGLLVDIMAHADNPGAFLQDLNADLCAILKRTEQVLFATAFYLIADIGSGELRWANAGHPDPLLLDRKAGAARWLRSEEGCDPALGLMPEVTYETRRTSWNQGDGVLLFTDGLIEAQDGNGEDFGTDRLRTSVERRLDSPMPTLCDALLDEVRLFKGEGAEASFSDDICIVGFDAARLLQKAD